MDAYVWLKQAIEANFEVGKHIDMNGLNKSLTVSAPSE
jgi:hypothetical protein